MLAAPLPRAGENADHGLVIRDARLVDGSGAGATTASVRVRGGRIIEVGDIQPMDTDRVIDARGLVLAPGFIDTHSHHDLGLMDKPEALAAVSQGITTIVVGQDGGSQHPLGDFFELLEAKPVSVNVASFSGHNTLRSTVMGEDFRRAATKDEIESMGRLLEADLAAGALGLSTGLEYDPGIYSTTEEVLRLAKVAAQEDGRYISHIRSEDRHLREAVEEAIRVGREAAIPVQISHLKLAMKGLWGQAGGLLDRLEEARAQGVDITADVYPYTYWQSTMTVLFPGRNFADLDAARFAVEELAPPEGILIARFDADQELVGRTLAEVAKDRKENPARTLLNLVQESQSAGELGGNGAEGIIATSMSEADVAQLLRWPHSNVASDGVLRGRHPRGFGAFPRVLARHVKDRGDLSLEEAVHKMSGLAARHMGIDDRGEIREGMWADLVLFDPGQVADRATPKEPHRTAEGIVRVWVNGREVYRDGAVTGERPGTVIRRAGRQGGS